MNECVHGRSQRRAISYCAMIFSSWLSCLGCGSFSATTSNPEIERIPDEILVDILSFLSVKDVYRSRAVCRKWSRATSTSGFLWAHLNRGDPYAEPPALRWLSAGETTSMDQLKKSKSMESDIGGCKGVRRDDVGVVTVNSSAPMWLPSTKAGWPAKCLLSNAGLIVQPYAEYNVWYHLYGLDTSCCYFNIANPITRETTRVITPVGSIYALFYHPVLEQPCVLWGSDQYSTPFPMRPMQFKLLNLGPDPRPKNIPLIRPQPPMTPPTLPLEATNVYYKPNINVQPNTGYTIVVEKGNVICWMAVCAYYSPSRQIYDSCSPQSCSEYVIAFDVRKDRFLLIPLPKHDHSRRCSVSIEFLLCLTVTNGFLTVIQHSKIKNPFTISIWVLKDFANHESWIQTHADFQVGQVPRVIISEADRDRARRFPHTEFVAPFDGDLVFWSSGEQFMFTFNPESGAIREFVLQGLLYPWSNELKFVDYISARTLVSLLDCPAEIRIPEDHI